MNQFDDQELRARFADLRNADRLGARNGEVTLGVPPQASRRALRPVLVIATTSLAVFAVLLLNDGRRAPPVDISVWRAPSDVLLDMARPSVLNPMPPLGASVIDQYLVGSTFSR